MVVVDVQKEKGDRKEDLPRVGWYMEKDVSSTLCLSLRMSVHRTICIPLLRWDEDECVCFGVSLSLSLLVQLLMVVWLCPLFPSDQGAAPVQQPGQV